MSDKDKKGLFEKISDKWAEARDKMSSKMKNAKNYIKEKFSKTKTKVVVSIGSLVLVGAILATACALKDNSPEIDIDLGNDVGIETTIDGEIINIPGTDTEQNISSTSLRSYLLNNPSYKSTYNKAMEDFEFTKTAIFDSHPYAFLEEKGHDVQGIKDGLIECETLSYTLEDDKDSVFMAVKVYENEIATHYHLEYELDTTPEKSKDGSTEMSEMELYKEIMSTPYIEAAHINDAVSKLKKPVKETCVKMSVADSKGLDNTFMDDGKSLEADYVKVCITSVNQENHTFDVVALPKFDDADIHSTNTAKISIATIRNAPTIYCNNGVYDLASTSDKLDIVKANPQDATLYDIQELNWSHCSTDFEKSN